MEEPLDPAQEARRELFRTVMMTGEVDKIRMRRRFRLIPRDPRCKSCNAPFGMPGAIVARAMGRRQWSKNPKFCDRCYSFLREYGLSGVEIPITVLFADVRQQSVVDTISVHELCLSSIPWANSAHMSFVTKLNPFIAERKFTLDRCRWT